MKTILLLNAFPEQETGIRRVLVCRHWEVIVRPWNIYRRDLRNLVNAVDMVVVNVVLNRPRDWALLAQVCSYRLRPSSPGVIALCPTRTGLYNPRLRAEALGARGVYYARQGDAGQ